MSIYGSKAVTIVYLEMKVDDPKYKSILYTDGVNNMWISRKYHKYDHVKNNDYKVTMSEWLAKKLGVI